MKPALRGPRLTALALALATLAAGPTLPRAALAESSDVVDAEVALRLAQNGDLLVTENLTFDYRGTFEGSYRDIELTHGETLSEISVSEGGRRYEPGGNVILGSHDRPGVFGVQDLITTQRVVWHYRARDEKRTFTISYRVRGGAVAYDDVIDVGWAVWGSEWDFDLDHLSAAFIDPALDPDDGRYRVWGHPREVEGETERGAGTATLEASDVPSGTAVELRVTLPRKPDRDVSGMRIRPGNGLPKILAAEQALDDDFNAPLERFKRWVAHNIVVLSLAISALAMLLLALLSALARERDVAVPEHLPEPPDKAGPALAYALAHEGGDSSNTVLATLLDLVDRGYYETSSTTTEKEKLDLALRVKPNRLAEDGALDEHERGVLDFFDRLLGGNTVALSEMRDRIPKHSALWRGRWQEMTEQLNTAEEGHLSWDRDFGAVRAWLVVFVAMLFTAATWIYVEIEQQWLLPVAIGIATLLAVIAWPRSRLRRVSAEQIERCERWRAFERWTEDFPRLSDDPPATLELWRRILVYGVAFGTAKRMIGSGRIPEPVVAASSGDSDWTGYAFTGAIADRSFNASAFSSGFASQVAPESSSSGGGGGFSGGGGGFSGGGGGGSW